MKTNMAGEGDRQENLSFSNTKSPCTFNLTRLRERVKEYIDKHHYDSAAFWADKLVSLSNGAVEDVYWYAQTLYSTGQYHRAAKCILNRKLHKNNMCCRYLAAKCHYECKEYQEALAILDFVEPCSIQPINKKMSFNVNQSISEPDTSTNKNMECSMNVLRGQIYEAMDNRTLAMECFKEALRQDVYCYEAFDLLVNHHMLSSQEERELIDSLPFSLQCPSEEEELVKFLYENKLKKYDRPQEAKVPESLEVLSDNLDIICNLAERHYYNCDFRECYKLTTKILNTDPYNSTCLPLHIAVMVELKKSNSLFYLAHKLVDLYPNKPVSWFAVGCYYFLIDQKEAARRYLSKATTLERTYGPAWLAFGHSFATGNEHDQAMAAYFTAAQLMKGCHLPALYIGLEYGLTNNPKLAERFFRQALSIAPDDPFVLHEMGVIAFQNEEWMKAETYFKDALRRIQVCEKQTSVPEKWEPLLNNLGHTCRKLRKLDEALEYHQQARILDPQSPSTYSAIGIVLALKGEAIEAVDYFHKALAIRRDDAFSTTMLSNLVESLMLQLSPSDDVEDSPVFMAPTGVPGFSLDDHNDSKDLPPPPMMRLTSQLEDSSVADSSAVDSSSLMIEEVEMGD
ncbi:cell division cycle protein 16 homolog [Ruditapes philippinarum]|uniref:cell division cycle protein 16 homolog n=1 Tax=Ruditapes philippinarum TaxID=129788 RepID=UPI00295BE9E0|nr:cell division cycle protein 16 homolog [Ruditapes philippinarum]